MSNGRSPFLRPEAIFALLFVGAIVAASTAAIWFVLTISPVHDDPAAIPSKAAPIDAGAFTPAVEESRTQVRIVAAEENLPGVSVAVAHDGEIVWAEGFGFANIEKQEPVTPATLFRTGSASKPLTAVAAARLKDQGRLDLDAPVQQYVTAFPKKTWPITSRQLMSDVAGVHHLQHGNEVMPSRHCDTMAEALDVFRADPLQFRPGSQYRFSNYGWVLLSAVIEGASGEPFLRYMTHEVFEPLGMNATLPDKAEAVPGRTSFYFPRTDEKPKLGLQDAPDTDYSCYAGGGVFLSTPSDLVRLGSVLVEPGFLKADTIAMLQTPPALEAGVTSSFALGWRVEETEVAGSRTRVVSHRGSPMGGGAIITTLPEFRLSIAVATNVALSKAVAPLSQSIAERFVKNLKARRPGV